MALLRKFGVQRLVDVRTVPRSRLTSAKEHRLSPMGKVDGTSITYPSEETTAH